MTLASQERAAETGQTAPSRSRGASKTPAAKNSSPKTSAAKTSSAASAKASSTKGAAPKRRSAARTPKISQADLTRLTDFYKEMLVIRRFEERTARAYSQALVGGYSHLNLGEEAFIVGAVAAMEKTDYLYTNYREHGFALARGIDPGRVMAELYGREDGVSKGWGGSMHMFDVEHRLMGGYAIVGGQIPVATGAALAIDYRGGNEAVVCTMGDGTTNIGAFHEALNIAALWDLPIVYLVDNNKLGMGTVVEKSSAEPDLHKRAASYRMASAKVNGLDPLAVYDAMKKALASARAGKPFLLEVITERLKGHSVVDPATYRTKEETAAAQAADPIPTLGARLKKAGAATDQDLAQWDKDAKEVATQADKFAQASPLPDVSTLFNYTYATPVPNESTRLPGAPLFSQPLEALAKKPVPVKGELHRTPQGSPSGIGERNPA
jgi:pyruvate dehydrogenase E1 component alpha subunit